MRDADTVVFVEVRLRRSSRFGGGAASVDAAKQRRLTKTAAAFLARNRHLARYPCRFDVVAVSGEPEAADCNWIRSAFDSAT